jgi:transcriptional antiterminator RfaH
MHAANMAIARESLLNLMAMTTESEIANTWFLAQVKPNSHQIAKRNLQRQGIDVFAPQVESTARSMGRFRTALIPLFPGYLFVTVRPNSGDIRVINSTLGITRLVGQGDRPVPVPTSLVGELMQRCDDHGSMSPMSTLIAGDAVRLTKGPFSEFLAKVENAASDQRVMLLLDILGRSTRVTVDRNDLRKL